VVFETSQNVIPPVEPPRGRFPARLDDKGRLKLPVPFAQYFNALPEKKLFVTSLDGVTAQIYPIAAWRDNEKFFLNYTEDPEAAADVLFTANDLGAEAEVDGQGRLTVNTELRRTLEMEDTPLHVYAFRGRVEVLTEAQYQVRKRRAGTTPTEKVTKLERAGLK